MQESQQFGLPAAEKRPVPPAPAKSDPSFFSPLSDRSAPKPSCALCGGEAKGGRFTEMDSGYPLGQVTGTVEFSCGCDGTRIFSISADNLAQWSLFRQVTPGVFRVKKLTEKQRLKEIADATR